jgi:hypothetical protein
MDVDGLMENWISYEDGFLVHGEQRTDANIATSKAARQVWK